MFKDDGDTIFTSRHFSADGTSCVRCLKDVKARRYLPQDAMKAKPFLV